MSFQKAPVRRFNEVGSDAPAPTAYNPKFDSDKRKGGVFPKSQRFSYALQNAEGTEGFVLPIPFPLSAQRQRSSSSSSLNRIARTPSSSSQECLSITLKENHFKRETANLVYEKQELLAVKENLLTELDGLRLEIDEFKNKLKIATESKHELEMEKDELTVKQESILNERDTLSEEKHHLLDEIEKLRVEMADKNHLISEIKERERIVSVENQKLMLDLETATKEQQALMSKVTELIQNDGVILEKLASATDQNNQLQILNSKQKHELEILEAQFKTSSKNEDAILSEKEKLVAEKLHLLDEIQSLTVEMEGLYNKLKIATESKNELAMEKDELTVKQESILNERDTLSEEKHHLLDEIEKLRVEMAEKNHLISEIKERERIVSVENQKLMLDLETATKEQQALMSKVTELIQNDGVILEKLASATDQNNQLQILNSKQKHELEILEAQFKTSSKNEDAILSEKEKLVAEKLHLLDEIQSLTVEMEGLYNKLKIATESKNELAMEKDELTVKQESILNERDTLSEEKHHLLDEIEKLRVEMAEKNHLISEIKERERIVSVENQKLMLDLETATKEQQALMSKVTELIQNDGVILEKLASATDQNNQLQILNSKQKHELEILEAQFKTSSKNEDAILSEKEKLVAEKLHLLDEIQSLTVEMEGLYNLLSESNEREKTVSVKNHDLIIELETASEEQQNLLSKVAELQLEVSLLNDKVLTIREELIMATDQSEHLQLCNTQLQAEVETLVAKLKSTTETSQEKAEEFRTLSEDYFNRLNVVRQQINHFAQTKKELKRTNKENQKLINKQNLDLEARLQHALKLEHHLKNYYADLQQRQAENETLRLNIDRLEEQYSILKPKSNQVDELTVRVAKVQAENERLHNANETLTALIAPFKDQLTSYELEVQMEKEGKVASDEKLKELQDKYAGILGHHNTKQRIKHIDNLKEQIVTMKKENEKFRMELHKSRQLISQLERERSTRQKQDFRQLAPASSNN